MKNDFDEQGYILLRGLIDSEELKKLRQTLDTDIFERYGYGIPDSSGRMPRMVLWRSPGDDVTGLVSRSEKVVKTVERLLGGEVYHFSTKLMMKEPLIGGRQEWHQDYGYWYQNGLLYPDALSVFIAIDKCERANGCLQVVPGSHKCGRIEHTRVAGQTGADLTRVEEILKKMPLSYVEMEAGDALFFHSNVLHQSDPNNSPNRRCALITAYNRASNDPVPHLIKPFYGYIPLQKVPNSAIRECTNISDFSGKDFVEPKTDKTVEAKKD
ncbi:hypothetical protein ScPMuIL_011631 [Solemya velum]